MQQLRGLVEEIKQSRQRTLFREKHRAEPRSQEVAEQNRRDGDQQHQPGLGPDDEIGAGSRMAGQQPEQREQEENSAQLYPGSEV